MNDETALSRPEVTINAVVRYAHCEHVSKEAERDFLSTVCDSERARARQFTRAEDRRSFLAAHWLLRHTLAEATGVLPKHLSFQASVAGRLSLTGSVHMPTSIDFSLTHTQGLVACVLTEGTKCGIDAEQIDATFDFIPMLHRVCTNAEFAGLRRLPQPCRRQRFFDLWVLKESYLKAIGVGIDGSFKEVCFEFNRDQTIDLVATDGSQWRTKLLMRGPTYSLGVVVRSDVAVRWDVRESPLQPMRKFAECQY